MNNRNKNNQTYFPKLKTETNFYDQKSILRRNNLPSDLCESLISNKIKKFKKIFSSLTKKKKKEMKNSVSSNITKSIENLTTINNNNNNKIIKENHITKKNSVINTEIELKINKLMDIFNTDQKLQKNAAYDLIKGRMLNKLKNCLVLKEQNYNNTFENNDDYSTLKKQKEFLLKRKYELLSKKKINIITNTNPKLFNTERITRRFEDLHMTPEEFLNKNFTKEEIEIMIKNANYFKLNKEPLKEWDLNINLTLKDSLNKEDEILNQQMRKKYSIKTSNNSNIKYNFNNDNEKLKNNNINNINIISQYNLKKEKYKNIPKLNLKNINHINNINNIFTEKNKKVKKKFRFSINPKNKLLYILPTTCSRHKRHTKLYNLTEGNINSKNYYKKVIYKLGSNTKHIERFENIKNQKSEYAETQNILNEIKNNYMKKNHAKITQDNIIKNKIKFNDDFQMNIKDKLKRMHSNPRYISIGPFAKILLSERLWK